MHKNDNIITTSVQTTFKMLDPQSLPGIKRKKRIKCDTGLTPKHQRNIISLTPKI